MRLTQDNELKIDTTLELLIIGCLVKLQLGRCDGCDCPLVEKGYQIAHRRYGAKISLFDLALKCGECHAKMDGKVKHSGTLRDFVPNE